MVNNRTTQEARNLIAKQATLFVKACIEKSQKYIKTTKNPKDLISLDDYNSVLESTYPNNQEYRIARAKWDGSVTFTTSDIEELCSLIQESLQKHDLSNSAFIGWIESLITDPLHNLEEELRSKPQPSQEDKTKLKKLERWWLVSLGLQSCSILPEIRSRRSVSWVHEDELYIRYGGRPISKIGFDGTDKLAEKRIFFPDLRREIESQHLQELTEEKQLRDVIAKLRDRGRYFSVTLERDGTWYNLEEFDENRRIIDHFSSRYDCLIKHLQECLNRKENDRKGKDGYDDDGYPGH